MLVLAFCATSSLYAQDKNPKTKVADRIAYMKSHLTLSQKESQSFWKLYEQYLNEEMKTMDNYRKNLEKQGIKLGAPGTNKETIAKLNDKQLTYLHDQKFQLRQNLLNLETTYYKKYKAVLTPHHLQDLYDLEYKYKKQMTQKKKEAVKEDPAMINTGKKKR
jgi:hypothetical protein